MSTTEPIRDREALKSFLNYYRKIYPNRRNYALLVLGVNSALRISDILGLQWGKVYDFENERFNQHVCIEEQKTGKKNVIALNRNVQDALLAYKKERIVEPEHYIFSHRTSPQTPISRVQAYRIVKRVADHMHLKNVSCHSMRKTFGYHSWKQGISPVLLMDIYNHSSYRITKRYLGIDQDDRDSIYLEFKF